MVNIPPIPPLLCSTPPPIDFGDDEDFDIMPPTLGDAEDDFCGFLVDDGIKTDEPLPSPRPSSVCDLPSISIYDGVIPPEAEKITGHAKNSSLKSPDAKKCTKSTNITEAFNFEVKNYTKDENAELQEAAESSMKSEEIKVEIESVNASSKTQETELFSQSAGSGGLSKNFKDLKIEPASDIVKCIVNKPYDEACMQNVVSIEDLEDDLSDDELYSPKTPKNFTENDNITDFFKIEEIRTLTAAGNNLKLDSNTIHSISTESKDNNKSASLQNNDENELKLFSSNSFIRNEFATPPPLTDDLSSNSNEMDDDFGDYADCQETHFVNNTVPVENVYINEHKTDSNFNDLSNYNKPEDYPYFNNSQIDTINIERVKNENMKLDFQDLSCNDASASEGEEIADMYADLRIATHTNCKNDKVDSLATMKNENNQPAKQLSHEEDNSLSDLSVIATIDDNEDFDNFTEFSCVPPDCANMATINATDIQETCFSNQDDDDDYGDFADFESHQNATTSEQAHRLSIQDDVSQGKEDGDDDDDDDDFGDFNTAEPFTTTTSSSMVTKASQNISSQTPIILSNNLNERISKILQLMFNPTLNLTGADSDTPKPDKIQDIPFTSIDAAKALEYQWLNSDTRHSFIRSLGIDSRNILYGDNWNPSLPRFAANLSFNPLKPMKPVLSSNNTGSTVSILEPIPVASAETNRAIEISVSTKKETLDLDWKSPSAEEQTVEAFKDNNIDVPIYDDVTSTPYTSNEPQTAVPESLASFENKFDIEGKLPKTPPISEMESVSSFTSPLPAVTLDLEVDPSQADMDESMASTNASEVVVTSTFTGSFKETHIYTPPKTNDFDTKHAIATPPTSSSSPTKSSPIDFDYEKAAMGVIIDETVVKKEYRDVEYNPPFVMDNLSKSVSPKMDFFETSNYINKDLAGSSIADKKDKKEVDREDEDANDDFSEFQSVSSDVAVPVTSKPLEVSRTATISHGGMILSPAILIPQAISLENQKPKIEWGDSTASINPEELARIEELFPEPKSLKSSSSSQKSTPTHQLPSAPSISATVANKELEGNINNINDDDDDDDWSDFVSVTVTNNVSANRTGSNNNVLAGSRAGTPLQQRSPIVANKIPPPSAASSSNNDDEWSDFVSSAPPSQQPNTCRVPQFNSGAWQNANFYNNPLSMYHKGPLNILPATTAAVTHSAQRYLYNNNNNYHVSQQPYPVTNNIPPTALAHSHQSPSSHSHYKQQQIHVMQNFSTAPVPTPERLSAAAAAAKNNQFQSIGSAKVAPSIALIPDLGFVAPAVPTHTSFINSLPKPSINMKK